MCLDIQKYFWGQRKKFKNRLVLKKFQTYIRPGTGNQKCSRADIEGQKGCRKEQKQRLCIPSVYSSQDMGITKSQTRLKRVSTHTHTHCARHFASVIMDSVKWVFEKDWPPCTPLSPEGELGIIEHDILQPHRWERTELRLTLGPCEPTSSSPLMTWHGLCRGLGLRTKDDQIAIKQPIAVVMVAIFEWVARHLVDGEFSVFTWKQYIQVLSQHIITHLT